MNGLTPIPTPEGAPNGQPALPRWRFRFSAPVLALLCLGIAFAAAGFALTTWQFVEFVRGGELGSVLEWCKYALLYLVSSALFVVMLAAVIRSEYILTEKKLILVFGVIRMGYPIESIVSVHLFQGARKLAVYFDSEKTRYTVIVIKEAYYDEFVRLLLKRSERIGFSFSTAEEEEEIKKKK